MKSLLYLLTLLILSSTSFAQKVSLERHGVILYNLPPTDTALQSLNTVYIGTSVLPDPSVQVEQKYLDQAVTAAKDYFGGFEQVDSKESADFVINTHFIQFNITKPVVKTGQTKSGDKMITNYTYSCNLTSKIHISISDKSGNKYFSNTSEYNKIIAGPAQSLDNMAKMKFDSEYEKTTNEAFYLHVKSKMAEAADKYCIVQNSLLIQFGFIKPKKFTYDEINACFDKFKRIAKIQEEGDLMTEEIDQLCQEIIEVMSKELTTADLEDKKARVNKEVAAALHYNTAMAYFTLELYDKALNQFIQAKTLNGGFMCFGHSQWIDATEKMLSRK